MPLSQPVGSEPSNRRLWRNNPRYNSFKELRDEMTEIFNCYWTQFIAIVVNVCVFLRLEEEYWYSTGFYDSKRSIDIIQVFTTWRGVLIFYRFLRLEEEYWYSTGFYDSKSIDILPAMFFLAESKFVHDLNFDFFLFELSPPFLIVDFWFRTLDFKNSLVCNVSNWYQPNPPPRPQLTCPPPPPRNVPNPPPPPTPTTTHLPPPPPQPQGEEVNLRKFDPI